MFLAMLALLLAVGYLLFYAVRGAGRPAAIGPGRWETHTEAGGGRTTVLVRRVTGDDARPVESDRQVIGSIPDAADDWDVRYHELMAQARARVAALRAQSD